MSANSIKVVARFRPQNRVELESGGKPIVEFNSEETCTVDVGNPCSNILLYYLPDYLPDYHPDYLPNILPQYPSLYQFPC